ncbi:MAG: metallopeptidase family protein [Propionibacteriaceae bacterium]|jgi:predicted Zn-dependent protease with MMP-like domain|nr:metallopeptidase family protein [Propionibacteriaceae bacterium]
MFSMAEADFDAAVTDALALIPGEFAALLENTVILVEDDAPPDDPGLLGLYDGVALTEQYGGLEFGQPPNTIHIFRKPILRICATREDVLDEIYITVVHEIAHHFGIDDAHLHELGWE